MTLCEDDEEKQGKNMAFCFLHVYGGGGSTEQESAFAVKFFSNENSEVFFSFTKLLFLNYLKQE